MAVVVSTGVVPVDLQFSSDSAAAGRSSGTKLLLHGQDITRFCCSFELSAPADGIVSATIGVMPKNGFELRTPAKVELKLSAYPGYALVVDKLPSGEIMYRSVKV